MKLKLKLCSIVMACCTLGACTSPTEPEPEILIEENAELDETIPAKIPHVYITTEEAAPILSKEDYINATVQINGNAVQPDLAQSKTRIKGRGNSTWGYPKKPYRLKLDQNASIFGLPAAKDWVLLANYNDYTLMCNAVAMKIGQQLEMPFTNSIVPVDVTLNGKYIGNYMLTQQIEVKSTRVKIGDDGTLLEMDTYFDEEFKFKSANLQLPMMIKAPDIKSDAQFNSIKQEFENFEKLLTDSKFPNNGYGNLFDKQQLVNFIILNTLVGNLEINHPKSTYIHKKSGGKYTMGPIWDFDAAFGLDWEQKLYFNYVDLDLLRTSDSRVGSKFFKIFLRDPEIIQIYKTTWTNYKNNKMENLLRYVEQLAASIRESKSLDFAVWQNGSNDLPNAKKDMKVFLRKRAAYIDKYLKTVDQ
ncbi:spore coat protein CotH [Sphingobacterium sp. DK4209]|uniref:Spore coat protein CotH n=1 Tax=Sphingobacterium zhuxiongii TaxID=2662364 RepID=A0A5Q0QDE6_9SPHI|nr:MULTISPECIES: CotH kinase family protein [unclassified Sphingobacterium]MVZ66012.1 spore coat protein CotH [Sphingobacterium sp. DK4209]QGA27533.1 spore coat protein CotH [Sphingobacterium sp. dk4302]